MRSGPSTGDSDGTGKTRLAASSVHASRSSQRRETEVGLAGTSAIDAGAGAATEVVSMRCVCSTSAAGSAANSTESPGATPSPRRRPWSAIARVRSMQQCPDETDHAGDEEECAEPGHGAPLPGNLAVDDRVRRILRVVSHVDRGALDEAPANFVRVLEP